MDSQQRVLLSIIINRSRMTELRAEISYLKEISTSTSLTMQKPLTVWIKINCGKFLKRWEYQTTLPAS